MGALKPWPNGFEFELAFRLATHLRQLASTCNDLRGPALTLVELKCGRK